ncbi:MAG TPA: hypothetical protein VEJ87_06225 [Acidimicrobiales bacterium]|nr:hypothetical protein [Acidimicrobiales bacterium]
MIQHLPKRALSIGIGLALALTSLGGALFITSFGGSVASAQTFDQHYLCYTATASGFKAPPGVRLVNAFAPNGFVPKIGSANYHCNPAVKIVPSGTFPITDPTLHYLCFKITAPQPANTAVVSNQFGTAALTTSSPTELCLPTWKSLTGPPNQTPNQPVGNHYTCYPTKYVAGGGVFKPPAPVAVEDEFSPTAAVTVKVGAPKWLCVPTTKILPTGVSYPIVDPSLYYVCFAVSHTPIIPKVFDENQFGQGPVTIKKTFALCVPSSVGPSSAKRR